MVIFNYIDERIEYYRNNCLTPAFYNKFLSISDMSFRDNPHLAENRTLDEPFHIQLSIYHSDGNEYAYQPGALLHYKHTLPFESALHKHEYIEFFYVIDGSFEQILLGETHHFNKGDFVITDQNCEHSDYLRAEESSTIFLQIKSDYLAEILSLYSGNNDLLRFLLHALVRQKREQSFLHLIKSVPSADSQSKRILEQLYSESMNRQPGSAEICKGLLLRLLNHLCMNYTPNINTKSKDTKEKATLYEIERYIRTHYANVDSTSLEAAFHYHRNYYNLLLKKYRGKTFKKYLQDIRLTKANELLQSTNMAVKEIAHSVGYENTSHFYHLYEEKYGHLPRQS